MANTTAWFALGGALGGVALTGVLSLVTAAFTHKWTEEARVNAERDQEVRTIRSQRREACHKYLVATNSYYQAVDGLYRKICRGEGVDPDEYTKTVFSTLQDTYVYLTISCGAKVRELARTYNTKLYELFWGTVPETDQNEWRDLASATRQVRKDLRAAMRAELGVGD